MLLVLKLPIMGKICPVRVLFHKLPPNVSNNSFLALLRCPKSPLRYLCIKSLLWTRKITLSRFRTVRKQSLFMDSKYYFNDTLRCPKSPLRYLCIKSVLWTPKTTLYDVQKPAQVLFKTVRKTTPLWTPKTPVTWF